MSEIALISARKSRLESSAKRNKSAQVALNLANSPNKFCRRFKLELLLLVYRYLYYSGIR
jgi:putative hemolysin